MKLFFFLALIVGLVPLQTTAQTKPPPANDQGAAYVQPRTSDNLKVVLLGTGVSRRSTCSNTEQAP